MSDQLPKISHAVESILMQPATGVQISDTLYEVVEKIGNNTTFASLWWESLSHGLGMPMREHFFARVMTPERYLEKETDFLHFDDEGFHRQDSGDHTGKPIEIGTENRFKSLALRVLAFMETRNELNQKGFSVPENPELQRAVEAIEKEAPNYPEVMRQFKKWWFQERVAGSSTRGNLSDRGPG